MIKQHSLKEYWCKHHATISTFISLLKTMLYIIHISKRSWVLVEYVMSNKDKEERVEIR